MAQDAVVLASLASLRGLKAQLEALEATFVAQAELVADVVEGGHPKRGEVVEALHEAAVAFRGGGSRAGEAAEFAKVKLEGQPLERASLAALGIGRVAVGVTNASAGEKAALELDLPVASPLDGEESERKEARGDDDPGGAGRRAPRASSSTSAATASWGPSSTSRRS